MNIGPTFNPESRVGFWSDEQPDDLQDITDFEIRLWRAWIPILSHIDFQTLYTISNTALML